MGKKGKGDKSKKKLTKKEKKAQNHLKLVKGKGDSNYTPSEKDKAA
jgi:hypothetical protein